MKKNQFFLFRLLSIFLGLGAAFFLLFIIDDFIYKNEKLFIKSASSEHSNLNEKIVPVEVFDFDYYGNLISDYQKKFVGLSKNESAANHFEQLSPYPNYRLRNIRKTTNGFVIFDVTYSEDFAGRRLIPSEKKTDPEKAVLFLGCSFTYGMGVEDNETLPYYFSKTASAQVINAARPANSISDVYESLVEKNEPKFQFKAKKIIVVFGLIENHLRRMSCDSACFGEQFSYLREKTAYKLKDDQIVKVGRHGDFYAPSGWPGFLLKSFKSITISPFTFPPLRTEENAKLHYALMSKVLEKLKTKYEVVDFYQLYIMAEGGSFESFMEQANPGEFKPILLPLTLIKNRLRQTNNSLQDVEQPFKIPADGHYNPPGNRLLADAVTYVLKKDHPEFFKDYGKAHGSK